MAFLPFLRDIELSRQLNDQNIGLPLYPGDMFTFANPPTRPLELLRQLRMPTILRDAILSGPIIEVDKEKFQISLDVQHFALENISVKTVDGYLVVEGRHDEKPDKHGFVARHFMRRYLLPEGCNLDAVESKLSSDGVLTVTAPLARPVGNERVVPIIRTGPVRTVRKVAKTDAGDATPGNAEHGIATAECGNAEPGDAEPDNADAAAVENGE